MRELLKASLSVLIAGSVLCAAGIPNPALDAGRSEKKSETAVFAAGCFWGVEAVFEALKGVSGAVSGYAGGSKSTADYHMVSTGRTGHAESVEVTYDPSRISYGQLLKVYFSVAHDPTEVNRQGPDTGPQYRSEIFYTSEEQKRIAEAYIQQLNAAKVFPRPIATKVGPLQAFYPAETYHQDFVAKNPDHGYVEQYDLPKLVHLRAELPELLKGAKP